jgi:uncharacterized membrane protein (TIGR02234 family)
VVSLLAGGLVLFSVGATWIRFVVRAANGLDVRSAATGHDVAGAGTALALVVLAGVVILPATRGRGRVAAGVLLALAGVGILIAAFPSVVRPKAAVAARAAQIAGQHGIKPSHVAVTLWPWLAIIGGVLALAVGLTTIGRSRRWPAMGRRYAAGAAPTGRTLADESMWERLDAGDDPTV